ncbi:MAG: GAF domain-containing protein [Chloroflexi bacterium]|nr:GAF domain-containing protein [Chloroflexota bacterium]
MRQFLDNIFDISAYTSDFDKERARIVYGISTTLVILYTLFIAFVGIEYIPDLPIKLVGLDLLWTVAILGFYACVALTYYAIRQGRLELAEFGPLAMWFVGGVVISWANAFRDPRGGIALVAFVVLAGLLKRGRGLVAGLVIAILSWTASNVMATGTFATPSGGQQELITVILMLAGIASLTYLFLRFAYQSRVEGARIVSAERLRLAEITSQIAQRISRRMALRDVLNNAVEQIRAEYPLIYHAQIFLLDENRQNAQLVASTGEVGRLLMERKHNLPVGSLSVIGQVTGSGQQIISRAGLSDSVHRRNEFLPETAVEAAFPLRIGDQVIGALDLQSKVATAFRDEDMPILQSLADHLAIAIDNARLFEETERRLQENRRLVEQTNQAVEQVDRLNRQLTGRFWSDYLSQQTAPPALTMDFVTQRRVPESEWTPTLREAVRVDSLVQRREKDQQVIAIPLRVRGQVIGAMEFELESAEALTPEEISLIQEVGDRLGLAVENVRLFEASQSAAQREALVNEIAARLQAGSTVEMTLNAAARSLKETMKASRVAIRLGAPPGAKNGVGEDEQP